VENGEIAMTARKIRGKRTSPRREKPLVEKDLQRVSGGRTAKTKTDWKTSKTTRRKSKL